MHKLGTLLVVVALLSGPRQSGFAQAVGANGFLGLALTPYGALPPVVTPTMLGDDITPAVFELRYGRSTPDGSDPIGTFGIGASFPTRGGHGSFALGLQKCGRCEDVFMVSVDFTAGLVQRYVGALDASVVTVAVRPSVGVARSTPDAAYVFALAGALDAPISFAMRLGNSVLLVPFITPGYAFGRSAAEGSDARSGSHVVLGGGIGLQVGPVVGLNVGGRRVFVEGAPTMWGLGLTIGATS